MSFVFLQIDFPHLILRKEGNLKKIVLMKETSKRYHQFIYEIFKTFFWSISISHPGTTLAFFKFLSRGSSYPWRRRLECLWADLCFLLLAKVFLEFAYVRTPSWYVSAFVHALVGAFRVLWQCLVRVHVCARVQNFVIKGR